jgi:hypothetical protein
MVRRRARFHEVPRRAFPGEQILNGPATDAWCKSSLFSPASEGLATDAELFRHVVVGELRHSGDLNRHVDGSQPILHCVAMRPQCHTLLHHVACEIQRK